MVSFRTVILALATALSVSADYQINPSSVDLIIREAWCRDERSTCPLICQQNLNGKAIVNTCDAKTLTYGCVCNDGLQPNVSEYSLTLPYHVCQQWGEQCVAGCNGDNICQSKCREDHPCGAQSPKRINATTSTTVSVLGASSTADASDGVFNGMGSSGAVQTDSPKGPGSGATLAFGNAYGLVVVLGSLFTGFALML
ncbi:hypothetical protein B0H63DRAFT_444643 [Podospora didyma]|uniref:DUF7707 domain-containing protein n=1 Tax=Podospora didyma TaxID=330526 RepID=A0AAE0P713_9PEZI|nr:hypothetical protein B0H63DRAFT_444643 [Podospora didyma]